MTTAPDFLDGSRHCDDYIDDPSVPECVRHWVDWERQPASAKYAEVSQGGGRPSLFARLLHPVIGKSYQGYWAKGQPVQKDVPMEAGSRVRLVMASRFGDVGITPNLKAESGYVTRLTLDQLTDFSEEP
jgi:hypothetical protein